MKSCFYIICETCGEQTQEFAKWLQFFRSDEFSWCDAKASLKDRFFQIPGVFDLKIVKIDPTSDVMKQKFIPLHANTYIAGVNMDTQHFYEKYEPGNESMVTAMYDNKVIVVSYYTLSKLLQFLLYTEQLRSMIIKEIKQSKKDSKESKTENPRIINFQDVDYLVEDQAPGGTCKLIERVSDAFVVDPYIYLAMEPDELGRMTKEIMEGRTFVFKYPTLVINADQMKVGNLWIKEGETMEGVFEK